ncbi:MAG: cyclic nucleotide-binding domain-containing protein [Spirochaetaceae bacterium]|jgi:CRP-like cAMP-binding protein|nr:cyclic nucleotide-binding domain-containing protein [Spirochaetaceae bacterium]
MGQKLFSLIAFKKGSQIAKAGSPSTGCFYVIHTGFVRLTSDVEIVKDKTSVIMGTGNFFSVISALTSKTNFESAVAESDAAIIVVKKEKFIDFIREYKNNALKILVYLSGRLKFLNEISETYTPHEKTKADQILEVAEYYNEKKAFKIAFYAYHRFLDYVTQGEKADHAQQMLKKLSKYADGVRFNFSKKSFYRFYPESTMIFSQNEVGNELFVIRQGSVRLTQVSNGNEKLITVVQSGDVIGETSIIEGTPRTCNAIAQEDCDILGIVQDDFPQLVKSDPALAMRISIAFSERVWEEHNKIKNKRTNNVT